MILFGCEGITSVVFEHDIDTCIVMYRSIGEAIIGM